jgi:hypothetical protein
VSRLVDKFKHAFAVEPSGPAEPNEHQREPVDVICREVVRRRLATPALLFLEMSRPLTTVSAALMQFFGPIATILVDPNAYRHFAEFIERRGSIEYLCRRIEKFENDSAAPRPPSGT